MKKMTDFGNHRRFTLRSLGAGITLVSVKLRNTIGISRSFKINKKSRKKILNERVSSINTTIKLSRIKRNTCVNQLASLLDKVTFNE